jgi:hypothetical protein
VVDTNVREPGLNFGSANPRPKPVEESVVASEADQQPAGLNFGSLNPRRAASAADVPEAPSE